MRLTRPEPGLFHEEVETILGEPMTIWHMRVPFKVDGIRYLPPASAAGRRRDRQGGGRFFNFKDDRPGSGSWHWYPACPTRRALSRDYL